jgi:hypothetical protein
VPGPSLRGARRLAGLLTALQALTLAGFAVYYVVELARGEGSDATRVLMSALLILLAALALAAVARGWLSTSAWPRTPTIVWNVLLLPVGVGLVQGNRPLAGWLVLGVGVVAGLAAVAARDPENEVLPGRGTTD